MKNSNSHPKKSIASKIRLTLLYLCPFVLFFSYHPILSIGSNETTNFEFSLPEIWLILFALVNFFDFKYLKKCLISFKNQKAKNFFLKYPITLLSLFPLYMTTSIIWSPNRLRAFLTVGILWLIIFAGINIYHLIKTETSAKQTLRRNLLISALIISAFCWLQCFLDLAGLSRDHTLLCLGCTHTAFGFPHPSGFAIEPQFMGNLLLAPTLLSLQLLLKKESFLKNQKTGFAKFLRIFTPIFLTATLFLTFSRGAIYAFLVAAGLLLLLQFPISTYFNKKSRTGKNNQETSAADTKNTIKSQKTSASNLRIAASSRSLLLIPTIIFGFAISLVAQGIFAELSPTSDTFMSGVAKSIHQLTLGKVDFRETKSDNAQDQTQPENQKSETPTQPAFTEPAAQEKNGASTFSGYVEESTSIRLNLTKYALDVWNDRPQNLIFGTGLGSAGIKMYEKFPAELGTPKEIVQNQYASLLLELGLLGTILAASTILYVIIRTKAYKSPLFVSVIIAFAATLFFFAGLPNAIHIYLFPFFL